MFGGNDCFCRGDVIISLGLAWGDKEFARNDICSARDDKRGYSLFKKSGYEMLFGRVGQCELICILSYSHDLFDGSEALLDFSETVIT